MTVHSVNSLRSEGFILVATLWVLAILTVLAAYVDGVTASDIDRALQARQALTRELDRRSTEATVVYLLVTGRMNYRGLIYEREQRFASDIDDGVSLPQFGEGALTVTDEVYAGLGGTNFAIQDELGLVPVNTPASPIFAAVLEGVGVSPRDAQLIAARVEDYVDVDYDLSLNGAERFDYEMRGLPPPPNWIMVSPLEMRRVLGVGELITPAQWQRLLPVLSMRQATGYNFNLMPPKVLAAVVGLDEAAMEPVVEARKERPIWSLNRLVMLTGVRLNLDEMSLRRAPSGYVRIATWNEGQGVRHLSGVELTPFGERTPWRKDYGYSEPVVAGVLESPGGQPVELPQPAPSPLLQEPERRP